MDDDPYLDLVVANRYQIVRKLGDGGMSSVYEAKHVKLHRSFALKVLLPALVDNEEAQQRFEREAAMLAGLNHPNVVAITDWEYLPDGVPCMVLEYLHGAPLRVRMARGPLPWDAIARVGDQVMSALSLAHRNGITHRDLKPDNVFIAIDDMGEDRVKLLDFGVSKLRGANTMTGVYNMLGTPWYMSPEQAMGNSEAIGPATDVWAMGAILYELATGRPAFAAQSLADTLMHITSTPPEPIAGFRPDAPAPFVELIARALSLDAERRITDVDELRRGLREALEPRAAPRAARAGSPVAAAAPAPAPLFERSLESVAAGPLPPTGTATIAASAWTRRRVLWIAMVAAVLISGGAAAIVLAT